MLEGSFYLPLPTNKTPDYCGAERGDHKVTSIGTETCVLYRARERNGSFFPQLPVNTLPYCGVAKVTSSHKITSIGAEADTSHPLSRKMVALGCHCPATSAQILVVGSV